MNVYLTTENRFLAKLIRAKVGQEKELCADLQKESPQSYFFKAMGTYDLLEICPLIELGQIAQVNCDPRILGINCFPLFSINDSSEGFLKALDNAITPSFILVKLQGQIFQNRGIGAIKDIAESLVKLGKKKVFAFSGLGYYELILWGHYTDINDSLKFVDLIRNKKIIDIIPDFKKDFRLQTLLLDTLSVPTISYKNVISSGSWDRIDGKVSPLINIKCAPGYEERIAEHLTEDIDCFDVLGASDLLCTWPKGSDDYRNVVQFIMNFRGSVLKDTVSSTSTILHSNSKLKAKPLKADLPTVNGPLTAPLFSRLNSLASIAGINPFLIGEITSLISLVNTQIGNRYYDDGFYEVIYSMLTYLNPLLAEYHDTAKKNLHSNKSLVEGWLMSFAHYCRAALNQQLAHEGLGEDVASWAFPPLAKSLYRIIKSISLIPEQLFGLISKTSPPEKLMTAALADSRLKNTVEEYSYPWLGFLYFDLSEGYRIIDQVEIISVPYKDAFNFLNWITVSHEVSHGYYVRLNFEIIEEHYLNYIHEGGIEVKFRKGDISGFLYFQRDTAFELFAHWFDYTHFFNKDLDFYIWSIWRTYLDIPRVQTHKLEYWARSLFIHVVDKWNIIQPKLIKIYDKFSSEREYTFEIIELLSKELETVYTYIQNKFPEKFSSIELDQEEKEDIANMVFIYHDLCRIFEEGYINKELVKAVNKKYSRLDKDISDILSGDIIEHKIPNPFLLLRELLHDCYMKGIEEITDAKVTLALIYSFLESSRKYYRST